LRYVIVGSSAHSAAGDAGRPSCGGFPFTFRWLLAAKSMAVPLRRLRERGARRHNRGRDRLTGHAA